ncbi:MAG: type II secretion system protein, partial [Fibrobacter sp.]|nr:type II secretion system protein [Fibrobacter sp.]
MKKQGFTLIELMVVIVIMGILAAVAVPKLFGMIAKSKASEVPTAAGTWINMQDAYFQEANDVGDWVKIGYTGPGAADPSNKSSYASNTF